LFLYNNSIVQIYFLISDGLIYNFSISFIDILDNKIVNINLIKPLTLFCKQLVGKHMDNTYLNPSFRGKLEYRLINCRIPSDADLIIGKTNFIKINKRSIINILL
jgi:hypothetical protein